MENYDLPVISNDTTPGDWLFIEVLGGCGCGNAEDLGIEAVRLLKDLSEPHGKRSIDVYGDRFYEVLAHWFDDKGLTEHGSSISGSWLTDKGYKALEVIQEAEKRLDI